MEPLVHLFLPVMLVLALYPRMEKRLVWGLCFLTVIPDLDVVVGHRSLLHNLLFVLLVAGGIWLAGRKTMGEERARIASYLALFYLGSHLLLDIGSPGVPLFYPFSDHLYGFNFYLLTTAVNGLGNGLGLRAQGSIINNPLQAATAMTDAPAVTTLGVVLVVLVLLLLVGRKLFKERRAPPKP